MTLLLLTDTTVHGVLVGLARVGGEKAELIWSGSHLENEGSSAALSILVEKGLKETGIPSVDDLSGIVVATGPGSFTGIKVGLAFCYGFARGLSSSSSSQKTASGEFKILGVCALQLACDQIKESKNLERAALFLPATRTQGYFAYSGPGSESEISAVDFDSEIIESLFGGKMADTDIFVVDSWPFMNSKVAALKKNIKAVEEESIGFSEIAGYVMSGMLVKVDAMWPNGFSAGLPEPVYLRKPAIKGKR